MAQNSHVPKFGDWEDDDIPYTAFFDNARRDKPDNNVKINPNDPEENPDAFMMMMRRTGPRIPLEGGVITSVLPAAQPPRRLIKSASATDKSRHAGEDTRHRRRSYHGNNSTATNSSTSTSVGNDHKSPTSESGSDQKTSSDYSLLHRFDQGRFVRSDDHKKKSATRSTGQGSDSYSSAVSKPGHRRRRSARTNNQHSSDSQHHHHRAVSIPKFGSWDVNDPTSGEGFTFIFDKVNEEKQSNAVVKVPTRSLPRPPTNYGAVEGQSKPGRISSCISKICCCMCSSGRERPTYG